VKIAKRVRSPDTLDQHSGHGTGKTRDAP
jgi:hypothetical protein